METLPTSPLAKLYTNPNMMTTLAYPSDLGTSRKGHWINFNISVPTKSTYATTYTPQGSAGILNAISASSMTSIVNAISHPIDTISSLFSTLGATNSSGSAYNAPIPELWTYTVTPGSTKLSTVISLYAPDTLSTVQHSHYSVESLGEATGVVGQLAAGTIGIEEAIKSGGGDTAIKNMAVEAALATATGSQVVVNAGLKAGGSAINPQMEVFFKDIDFRTFQFDFLFTPRSASEAETVRAIIQAFKFHAAPELDKNNSAGGRYYIVPSVFEIQMYKDGQKNENVGKYGVCACETVNVDYAPQGWVTHEDGMPVQTRLTLQFKEMEIMTKERIAQGY